ncbi:MAG: MarR family transcriptional regulator, partial [Acidaminococcus sp.]|nr:MarR family transcriptional regulator [Acidaminococcus sp.]
MKDIEICYTSFDKILKYLKAYSHNEMKNYNLTPNEIQVLSNLDTKCTSSEIAKQVNVSKALVSRSVKLLLQKGYITAT